MSLVRAFLHETPSALHSHGPHGITLLEHAKKGGNREMIDYLEHLIDPHKGKKVRHLPKPKLVAKAKPKRRRAA
jgi:hypothetical protein